MLDDLVFESGLEMALNSAVDEGFDSVYFVWWNQDICWYQLELINNWVSVHNSGRISVYKIF